MERISTSQALQIAGRAGRYGTQYEDGEVTTFRAEDLLLLKSILAEDVELIEVLCQTGLYLSSLSFWWTLSFSNLDSSTDANTCFSLISKTE